MQCGQRVSKPRGPTKDHGEHRRRGRDSKPAGTPEHLAAPRAENRPTPDTRSRRRPQGAEHTLGQPRETLRASRRAGGQRVRKPRGPTKDHGKHRRRGWDSKPAGTPEHLAAPRAENRPTPDMRSRRRPQGAEHTLGQPRETLRASRRAVRATGEQTPWSNEGPRGTPAEREGFEPSVQLPVHMISSHAPSATRSPLQSLGVHERRRELVEPRRRSSRMLAAERVGFEPTVPFRVHLISNQAPSAARSSLRGGL